MNSVSLVGRLTRDPELRYTPSGIAYCFFTIAVDRTYKGNGGRREADFIPVKVWGRPAEAIANFGSKGSLVSLSGRIESRTYEGADGNKKYAYEVAADDVRYLGLKNEAQTGADSPTSSPQDEAGSGTVL